MQRHQVIQVISFVRLFDSRFLQVCQSVNGSIRRRTSEQRYPPQGVKRPSIFYQRVGTHIQLQYLTVPTHVSGPYNMLGKRAFRS